MPDHLVWIRRLVYLCNSLYTLALLCGLLAIFVSWLVCLTTCLHPFLEYVYVATVILLFNIYLTYTERHTVHVTLRPLLSLVLQSHFRVIDVYYNLLASLLKIYIYLATAFSSSFLSSSCLQHTQRQSQTLTYPRPSVSHQLP